MAVITGSSFKGNAMFDQVVKGLQQVSSKTPEDIAYGMGTNTQGEMDTVVNPVLRSPWVMSTVEMLQKGEGILWRINPSDIAWSMPQRSTLMKTMQGTVLHVWPKSGRNTFFDEMTISLTLQSGSIMPQLKTNFYMTVSEGAKNFNAFLQLYDSPKITADGRPNYVIIKYKSHIFPDVTLMGWFDPNGVKFNDTSNEPGRVDSWTVDFTILYTIPALTNPQARLLVNQTLDELQYAQVPKEQLSTDYRNRQDKKNLSSIRSPLE